MGEGFGRPSPCPLTDQVVPEVPLRQWVLSVLFELRLLLARAVIAGPSRTPYRAQVPIAQVVPALVGSAPGIIKLMQSAGAV